MYVRKGETFYTFWTPELFGRSPRPTGALPRFVVFNDTTPIYSGSTTHGYGISGIFGISIPTTGALFTTGAFYNVSAEATLSGQYRTNIVSQFYLGSYRSNGFSGYNSDVYHADVNFCKFQQSGLDRYSCFWFRNGSPITGATSIEVFYANGYTPFLPLANMQLRGSGIFIYDSSLLAASGDSYIVDFIANLGGATRRWRVPISRDYSV